ncbi:lysozyme [Aquabacterium sp.]|uniref:lysozyme n=1 Tax=Aquabacterium sp. TaxID=1872578 RepID=UPI0025C0CC34|nr:lysozyme [Aquabacterium sp.]
MSNNAVAAPRRGLVAIVGAAAAAALYTLTPSMEGTVYKTYRDPAGILTYCTGATEDAAWGKTYTPAECKAQLDRDLARHAEGISKCVKFDKLTDGQRVAYVDFAYNVGVGAFCGSTIARKANAGDLAGSCDALLAWNKAKAWRPVLDKFGRTQKDAEGKVIYAWQFIVLPGLARRRDIERDYCLGSRRI